MQPIRIAAQTAKYKCALILSPLVVCGSDAFVEILNMETRTPVISV